MPSHALHRAQDKAVLEMFQRIALRYDIFNTVATLGRDGTWRRITADMATSVGVETALDVATGTGKLALELARRADRVTAFDFADRMVKVAYRRFQGVDNQRIAVLMGDAMAMPFRDNGFDCATIGFGLRNVSDLKRCLEEFLRVLRPGGRLVVLEISRPAGGIQRFAYETVFKRLLPFVGWAFSGDRNAYRYLPDSVDTFPSPTGLADAMFDVGFVHVEYRTLHFQTITLHVGVKAG